MRPPAAILFACNFNSVRSPMAEGLTRRLYGDAVFTGSCGVTPHRGLDPLLDVVMREVGIDLSGHLAVAFDEMRADSFDMVVCFTPESLVLAERAVRGCAVEVEHWPLMDPTRCDGSRDAMLNAYRQTREILRGQLVARFGRGQAEAAQ